MLNLVRYFQKVLDLSPEQALWIGPMPNSRSSMGELCKDKNCRLHLHTTEGRDEKAFR